MKDILKIHNSSLKIAQPHHQVVANFILILKEHDSLIGFMFQYNFVLRYQENKRNRSDLS